jgi:superfamily I DNA/RNA helicase
MSSTRIYADLMKLSLAMKSYQELGGDAKGLKKAETILKRYKSQFDAMVDTMIEPLLEEGLPGLPSGPIQTKLTQSRRGEMDAEEAIGVASALQEVMGWFNSRLQKLREAYPDQKTKLALCAISSACHDDFIDLNALLQAPRASRATTIGKWIAMACEELDQANEVELAIADLQETNLLAEEIKSIDARIRGGNLSEDDRLTLLQDRETKFDHLLDMSQNSSNRQAVLSAASSIINTSTSFQTRTGEKQGLTPEQEEAMMVSGKSIIAAGAGSGKTRVLASKIAYTINELGVSPSNIIATTFSNEAAEELKKRALKYSDGTAKGKYVGNTTHSIANSICYGANIFGENKLIQRGDQASFLTAAIAQVTLRPTTQIGDVVPTPLIDTSKATQAPSIQENLSEEDAFQQDLKDLLIRTTQRIADKALWGWNDKGAQWASDDLNDLGDMIVSSVGNKATLLGEDHPVWENPRYRAMINDMIRGNRGARSLEDAQPFPGFTGKFASEVSVSDKETPLNQWFNLGINRADMVNKDLSEKDYSKFIGIAKSKLQSPTELWFEAPADEKQFVAVYGAYEYLKTKKKVHDFDDMLLNANKVLVEDPQTLRRLQATYKYIFVDEAQDLNESQHILFGLIAGHIDPTTLKPYGDGRMTADTFCFIGDDKQAIYEFRGAEPEEFINISDSQGGEFKTSILRTNFRSGRNIVQAANKLIAHNDKQIPMTCNPNASKEEGRVSFEGYGGGGNPMSPGALDIAEEMKQVIDIEGWDHEGGEQHKFGVGCRTNKELKGYAFELLIQGLPYYSKKDLLDSKTMTAPIDLMSVKSSNPVLRAKALFSGHRHLLFYIDKKFNEKVEQGSQQAGQHPLDWYLSGGYSRVYPPTHRRSNQNAKAYADMLQSIIDFEGDNQELIDFVCYVVRDADGQNLMERLGRNLSASEVRDLAEETESGEVTQENMEDYADSGTRVVRRVMEDRTLEEGIDFFMTLKEQSKAMQNNKGKKNCVFLGTMHSWKGLECRDMYLPMTAGEFPDERSSIESERRLAYVAITRGQDRVKVLYGPGKNPENPHTGGPSQFISEACIPSEGSLNLRNASFKGATVEDLDFMSAMKQFLDS